MMLSAYVASTARLFFPQRGIPYQVSFEPKRVFKKMFFLT